MTTTKSLPFPIGSFEELAHILLCQRIINNRVREELYYIPETISQKVAAEEDETRYGLSTMEAERELLAKYANRMTLTESGVTGTASPHGEWGATFGVTLIIGETILQHLRGAEPAFAKHHRYIFLRLLMELDKPTGEGGDILDPIWTSLRVKGNEEATKALLQALLESMVLISVEYGLVESREEGYHLTPVGLRCLYHLVDAQRFIEAVAVAHDRFQESNPKRRTSL